jgi:carboxyl-terminal processing protease
MPRWNLAWLLGIAAVVLLGYTVSHSAPTQERDQDYKLVQLLVDVLDEVDHRYVRSLTPDEKRKLVEDMINGGLVHLDAHSTYINSSDYKRFAVSSKGKFGGVGIQLEPDSRAGGALTVESPMVDTPAYNAGVQAGDIILKIDGKSTENMHVADAVSLITGEPGTKVVLTVLHEGEEEPSELTMERAEIRVPSVLGEQRLPENPKDWSYWVDKDSKIALVRVLAFTDETAADLRAVLEKLQHEGARGLILDLRSNPGGLLLSAVKVCEMFIKEGRIVSTRGRNQEEEVYDAKGDGVLFQPAKDFPIAVLINRYSASASEIVAAALQDHKRAVVVGERSYGKGSVQNVIMMEKRSSALKLTTASYWRPSGKNIHRFPDSKESDEWGVKPDSGFEVALKPAERREYFNDRRERDIVRVKTNGDALPPKSKKEPKKDGKPFVDRTLQRALEYIRQESKKVNAS